MGIVLLGIWLIITCVAVFVPALIQPPVNLILAVLGIIAGILVAVGR